MPFYRIYIGKLPRDITERELKKLVSEFGPTREIRILSGFAFVEFDDARDARDAVDKLDGSRFAGERIHVEPARAQKDAQRRDRSDRYEPRSKGGGKYRITVDNLSTRTSWQASAFFLATLMVVNLLGPPFWSSVVLALAVGRLNLKDLMRKAGNVVFADVDRDGKGFVEFASGGDMEEAIKMFDDYDYEGQRLVVKEDRTAASKDSGRDRSRSRSRSRERSRNRSRERSSRGRDRSRSRSRDRSPRDRSRSKDRKDSKRRSESPEKSRSASPPVVKEVEGASP
ncbi:hypothetical protein HDU67_003520 [Dinochytrium kinnereticum]|nr:hypothetical protein HDU67_003520 [Dinochytrium kinnereticum]